MATIRLVTSAATPECVSVDGVGAISYCRANMNFKLVLKTLFIIATLSLLVLMGLNNPNTIELRLPKMKSEWPTVLKQPAAIMYFGFFGVGFLAGTIVMAGGGKKSSKSEK